MGWLKTKEKQMFKEYEVVFRAIVMTTANTEKEAVNRMHYQLSSALDNIDGLLVGQWTLQTIPTVTIKQGEVYATNDNTNQHDDR